MANTFELIQTVTVPSNQASIELASIPGTYTDILIKLSLRGTGTDTSFFSTIFFNSSSANFTSRSLVGSGSAASSSSRSDALLYFVGANATSNTFSNGEIYIPNYAGSTNKSFSIDSVGENNATASRQEIWAGLWSQTAAITNFKITAGESTNFATGSTASIYGILKGSGGATVS